MERAPTSTGPVPGGGRLLESKIAIITGASRGIGAAAARAFAAEPPTCAFTALRLAAPQPAERADLCLGDRAGHHTETAYKPGLS